MTDFTVQDIFPLGEDETPYRQLTADYVGKARFNGQPVTFGVVKFGEACP